MKRLTDGKGGGNDTFAQGVTDLPFEEAVARLEALIQEEFGPWRA